MPIQSQKLLNRLILNLHLFVIIFFFLVIISIDKIVQIGWFFNGEVPLICALLLLFCDSYDKIII